MSGHNYKQNYIISLVMMAFFAIVGVYSSSFKKTAGIFPVFASIVGVVCGLALIIETFIKQKKHEEVFEAQRSSADSKKKTAIIFLALILYALGVSYIGFAVSSLVFLLAVSILFSEKKDVKSIVILAAVDVIIVAVVYVLFAVLMKITLPHKLLF